MIRFVLAMLYRESRSATRQLLLFVLCIAAGVGGLVAVKAFSIGLDGAIQSEARSLLAADMVMVSQRAFTPKEENALAELEARGVEIVRSYQFIAMGRSEASPKVQTISVRAVENGYPFYGEVVTGSGKPMTLDNETVLVENALLLHMGLAVGDPLEIGERTFTIADTLVKEPDSPVQMFRLGPRVLMTEAAGQATGLISPRSRIRFAALMRLTPPMNPFQEAAALRQALPERGSRINTYDRAQPRVSRFMGRLTDYLKLVGLVALLLGGIGVAGAIRVFMARKIDALAVLKCLGATWGTLLSVYLLQVVAMGLLGSVIGIALGYAAQSALPWLLGDLVPVTLKLGLPWSVVGEGLLLGSLTAFWFALPPLLSLRKVPPARVFRRQVEAQSSPGRTHLRALATGAWGLLLAAGLAVWQTGHGLIAMLFIIGLAATVSALYLAALGLLALLKRLPRPPGFEWRQGLSSLYRPGNQSASVVVSLGIGVLLLLAVFLVQQDLLRQVAPVSTADPPNLFFLDIQPNQAEAFTRTLKDNGYDPGGLIPVVRGRIVAINGEPVQLDKVTDDHSRRHLRYEYTLTFRGALQPGEEVLKGRFGHDPEIPGAQVSISDGWARGSGLKVGSTMEMDIVGQRMPVTVTSVRRINWASRRANFNFVFMPGALEKAPRMYVAAMSVPDEAERVEIQRKVVNQLPNITVLDVQAVYLIIQRIMDRIALVIQFMAGFCIVVGLVILLGAIATTRFQRLREAVLLKTLGATRGAVARILTLEYLLLGTLAGAVGTLAAGVFSWGLVTLVFEGRWTLSWPVYLFGWGGSAFLVATAGLASSLDVLMRKPLEVLREE